MIQEEYIQTLSGLGLSFLQAKTYMNLAKIGKADARTISKSSSVARTDVYRIMLTLEKLGLVERIIAETTIYKATPIKESLSILLQKRREESSGLEKKANSLLESFQSSDPKDALEENPQFKITSEIKLLLKMHENLIRSAQASVDIIMPAKILQLMLFNHQYFFKEAQKSVKIRIIIQKVGEKTSVIKPEDLSKKRLIEIRYSSNSDLFGMHIFDGKEVTYQISEKNILPSLWSNDCNVLKLAESYFENIWTNAEINL
jgi:sugar-specific transcriptional regulator TrmB